MWVFDRDSLRFLEINQAALDMHGCTHDEFMAMSIGDLRPAEDVPALIEALRHPEIAVQPIEWRHRLKNGSVIDLEVVTHDIRYAGRNAVLVVLIDVTRR